LHAMASRTIVPTRTKFLQAVVKGRFSFTDPSARFVGRVGAVSVWRQSRFCTGAGTNDTALTLIIAVNRFTIAVLCDPLNRLEEQNVRYYRKIGPTQEVA
jgi:hypothetical protein